MEVLITCFFFALGAVLASFVGVLAERVYTGEPLFAGRSRCNSCSRQLTVLDLVPLFSWLLSRGRCRTCKARVPFLYSISEGTLGVLFALAYSMFGLTLQTGILLIILSVLLFIVLYDLRHMIVPPLASGVLVLLSVLYAFITWSPAVLGPVFIVSGVIATLFFLLFALSRGRAMGLGDSPVALALSLVAGPQALAGLLFSFWAGAIIGIGILVSRPKGTRMGIEVPFVPFLALGYVFALFTQWNPLLLTF
ncbi:prepilin peptidase [Patescibacteria group bacterium]|nr:prepilin peptidase [Patescibacteria group bacterium]MBU1500503.1 prepilin peptidase [Patescibacteria group bacterium]MBU2080698.1 prepilin peptidase [Patescibacteria group bacterium]MBU2123803.1 prepilin peptidase [Patescibacteria group bacterium]MBU2194906.1 prepilin peptidase [Patescibacteria group bacterium]